MRQAGAPVAEQLYHGANGPPFPFFRVARVVGSCRG
jgi:hypothetical protein